ncbi:MAG: T9SS type A sorting domain-containing protein [Bacteroidales bacterium]|nr:T9SS type A sorting domain-containing protein [Bacteroidales bacterium]
MKIIFTLFAAMLLVVMSYAQLTDGAIAPDFSLYEINKTSGDMITDQTINLYSMLNDYKTVFIDVSATTCSPCYAFHQGGTLEHLYNNYGPNSSVNDSRVLFVEGASTGNSWAAINGSAGSSYWDCTHVYNSTTLVPYPVIPLRISPNYPTNYNSFHSGFNIGYFPTIYMICPNRMVYNLTNSSSDMSATYHNVALQWSPAINNTNDAFIGYKDPSAPVYYCGYNFSPSITLQNVGSANLTSATLRITDGNNVQTVNWTGNLAQFATTQVPLSTVTGTENGAHSVVVEIVDVNGVADEGSVRNSHTESFWVVSEPEGSSATQDFSSEDVAPWCIADFSGGGGVMPSSGLFVYNDALLFYAYSISSGKKCEFVAPMMDFTNISDPKMTFDYAHRRYSTSNTERLRVKASADCGTTWTTVWEKYGATLATVAGTYTSNYTNPTAAQFKNAEVDLTAFAGQSNVIVKFEFISGYGNNVWVDNINITNGPLAVESVENSDLSIFPNPVKDVLTINYDKAISQIDVYDVNGKLVKTITTVDNTINVSDLSEGVYMLNMQTEEGLVIRKIVKE